MNRTATSAASPLPPDLARPQPAVAKSPEEADAAAVSPNVTGHDGTMCPQGLVNVADGQFPGLDI